MISKGKGNKGNKGKGNMFILELRNKYEMPIYRRALHM